MQPAILLLPLLCLALPGSPTIPTDPGTEPSASSVGMQRGNTTTTRSTGAGRNRRSAPRAGNPQPTGKADAYQLDKWFGDCDTDGNSWISFYEAQRAIRFGRDQFRSYDKNLDGRLVREEFVSYYRATIKRNSFTIPRSLTKVRPPQRTAQQLLLTYDADLNGGVSLPEARRLLNDYSRVPLDVESLFSTADLDKSKILNLSELETLGAAIQQLNMTPEAVPTPKVRETYDTFFLQVLPSHGRTAPPRLQGPISTFRRLDIDGNGFVSGGDLQTLQGSVQSNIRPQTILHTLDLNQDGVLDDQEFRSCLQKKQ